MMAFIGSVMLALCGIPLAYTTWKTQDASQINTVFLVMWSVGEVLLAASYYHEIPLMINYIANILALLVIWHVKLKA